jgi:hypothetical protein
MIEISISRELATTHPGFMAGCAQRRYAVDVFDNERPEARPHEMSGGATDLARGQADAPSPAASGRPPWAHIGTPHPELGFPRGVRAQLGSE